MLQLTCPNCGPRNASEFRHGGEANARPPAPDSLDERAWVDFLYMKANTAGQQTDRQQPPTRSGCHEPPSFENIDLMNPAAHTATVPESLNSRLILARTAGNASSARPRVP